LGTRSPRLAFNARPGETTAVRRKQQYTGSGGNDSTTAAQTQRQDAPLQLRGTALEKSKRRFLTLVVAHPELRLGANARPSSSTAGQ
jgi:hypothetical protein